MYEYGGNAYLNIFPYEMSFDVGYSMKLSESSSMGVTLRYIRADMGTNLDDELQPDNAFAADISGYTERYVYLGDSESLWSGGFNFSNIGTKVTFDGGATNEFLPANLRLGTGLLVPMDDYNQIGFYLDLNKYLVPVYPVRKEEETDDEFQLRRDDYNSISNGLIGAIKSFSGESFSDQLSGINISVGAEYNYNSQFFVRGGYHHESQLKGNRRYFSAGAGFKMSVFQLDAAYLISTVQSNPLDQTLRFSLSFDMDGLKSLFQ
jgi:opacity protein-like surface antigen